ncbi:hypothetical protein FQR65_LT01068 [Abscondita terminalis]|nr:hypothetical protein FQR65_LT01068 [Abscondita terminalis]
MPNGNVDKPVIKDNLDCTVSIKYDLREGGLHKLSVKYLQCSGNVTDSGPAVTLEVSRKPSNFTISTRGGLSIGVEDPSKAKISCHDNKDGTVPVSYLPTYQENTK